MRDVEEEGLGGVGRLGRLHHRDGPVGEVVREVVALRVGVDLDRGVVLQQPVRVVQVGEAVQEAVEAVEAALARPGVPRAGVGAVGVLGQVPLPDHQRRVALVAQDLRRRGDVLRQLHRIAREARVGVGDVAHPDRVRVEPGQEGRARRRAHRRDVEVGVAQPTRREGVQVRRRDLRAVAPEVGEPEVVGQDDHDVRLALRRRPRRPERLRPGHRASDPTLKALVRRRHRRTVSVARREPGSRTSVGPCRLLPP